MASPNVYIPGGSLGARLATRSPLFHSGSIWYVGPDGADAASPAGRQRTAPLATLGQAFTNAAAGDTIQVLAGTTIPLVSTLTLSKAGLHIYSEGDALTRARITNTGGTTGLSLTAAGVWVENFTFDAPTFPGAVHAAVSAADCKLVTCALACDSNVDRSLLLSSGADSLEILGCAWVSTAVQTATRPPIAIEGVAAISDLLLDTVVIDGAAYGWSDYAIKLGAAVTRLVGIDVDLLNDSDMQVATGSQYKFHRRLGSGSQRVEFAA